MKPPTSAINAAHQLLPLVLEGEESALWACVRLAQRHAWLELLTKATDNWRGYTLSQQILESVTPKVETPKKPRTLSDMENRLMKIYELEGDVDEK